MIQCLHRYCTRISPSYDLIIPFNTLPTFCLLRLHLPLQKSAKWLNCWPNKHNDSCNPQNSTKWYYYIYIFILNKSWSDSYSYLKSFRIKNISIEWNISCTLCLEYWIFASTSWHYLNSLSSLITENWEPNKYKQVRLIIRWRELDRERLSHIYTYMMYALQGFIQFS